MAEKKESTQNDDAGFFAIIPATVRYDSSIPQGAKLLYGEITALAKKKGYCWARNEYFSGLYQTSERTIIEWISRLRDAGHINVYLEYFPNSKKIKKRYISLPYHSSKNLPPELARSHLVVKKSSPLEGGLIVKKTSPLDDLVVKKTSLPSGEENSLEISTDLKSTSSSSEEMEKPPDEEEAFAEIVKKSDRQNEKPPDVSQAKTAYPLDIPSLKRLLLQLNPSFVLTENFYPKALDFLAIYSLDPGYVLWLYKVCVKKEPKALDSYFYTIFCDPRQAELYKISSKPPPSPPVKIICCPVCSCDHDASNPSCPKCGLGKSSLHNADEIRERKHLYFMPPDEKAAYEEELKKIWNEAGAEDIKGHNRKVKALNEKYGF